MKGNGLFITGTDTGVGKTWVTTRLIERLRATGVNAAGMKPIECGGREDATAIFTASGGSGAGLTLNEVNPISFPEPIGGDGEPFGDYLHRTEAKTAKMIERSKEDRTEQQRKND